MNKQFLNVLMCIGLMGFVACKKSDTVPTPAEDDAAIKAFVAKKSWSAQATPEGVYVVIDVVGTGATPVLTDYINIKFKGYLLNETLMSNSKDSAVEFKMAELIEGLKIGLQKFNVGGKGKIIIPAALAFGTQGSSSAIPPNSNIYFDVELVSAQATNGEDKKIKDYIAKKGWTAVPTTEGVYVVMDSVGSGPSPTLSSIIKVYYKGYMLDETVFDSNLAPKAAVEFPLGNLIRGWQIGFQQFKAGGKGKLLIPSAYAYGSAGSGAIPPNTPLVFEVELVSFK